jgi:hypothetical protein
MWRICSVFSGDDEWAGLSEKQIRAVLIRLLASLGPSRTLYLAGLSASRAQALVDQHAMRGAVRNPPEPDPEEPEEK